MLPFASVLLLNTHGNPGGIFKLDSFISPGNLREIEGKLV
jgi:hypothetical protein